MKKMSEEEKKMLSNGQRDPDIVTEAKAAFCCLVLAICGALVVAAVYGLFCLIEYLIRSLC